MARPILSLVILATFLLAAPADSLAEPVVEIVDLDDPELDGITISVSQNVIHVSGAAGLVMAVYNVAGVCVTTIRVDGDDKHFDLNLPKGCYIIKVGKVVRKVSIR